MEIYETEVNPKEGDLYKIIKIGGHTFSIYYGYYGEEERLQNDIMPIFPDLHQEKYYDEEGYRIMYALDDGCEHFDHKQEGYPSKWCLTCVLFPQEEDIDLGICKCEARRKSNPDSL